MHLGDAMVRRMRTTLNVDEHLLRSAKELAARSDRSVGEVVDDALRTFLAERHSPEASRVRLPVYGGSGLQPGVDLEDKDALAALLHEADGGDAHADAAGHDRAAG